MNSTQGLTVTHHFQLSMSEATTCKLEEIAAEKNTNPSDILSRAIALYSVAARAEKRSHHLAILDKNSNVLNQIIGI